MGVYSDVQPECDLCAICTIRSMRGDGVDPLVRWGVMFVRQTVAQGMGYVASQGGVCIGALRTTTPSISSSRKPRAPGLGNTVLSKDHTHAKTKLRGKKKIVWQQCGGDTDPHRQMQC